METDDLLWRPLQRATRRKSSSWWLEPRWKCGNLDQNQWNSSLKASRIPAWITTGNDLLLYLLVWALFCFCAPPLCHSLITSTDEVKTAAGDFDYMEKKSFKPQNNKWTQISFVWVLHEYWAICLHLKLYSLLLSSHDDYAETCSEQRCISSERCQHFFSFCFILC